MLFHHIRASVSGDKRQPARPFDLTKTNRPNIRRTTPKVWPRWLAGFVVAFGFLMLAAPAAQAETRTLKLYFVHTKERAEITFKRNGRYDQAGLKKINMFLRDWRRNEPTKMIPACLTWCGRPIGPPAPAITSTSSPPTVRPPRTRCCASARRASPTKASTCSARRWTSTFQACR